MCPLRGRQLPRALGGLDWQTPLISEEPSNSPKATCDGPPQSVILRPTEVWMRSDSPANESTPNPDYSFSGLGSMPSVLCLARESMCPSGPNAHEGLCGHKLPTVGDFKPGVAEIGLETGHRGKRCCPALAPEHEIEVGGSDRPRIGHGDDQ